MMREAEWEKKLSHRNRDPSSANPIQSSAAESHCYALSLPEVVLKRTNWQRLSATHKTLSQAVNTCLLGFLFDWLIIYLFLRQSLSVYIWLALNSWNPWFGPLHPAIEIRITLPSYKPFQKWDMKNALRIPCLLHNKNRILCQFYVSSRYMYFRWLLNNSNCLFFSIVK